jgi:formylglycine-generating enzyme required for sulfatase activity
MRWLGALLFVVCLSTASGAGAQAPAPKRIALLIGNQGYLNEIGRLTNPFNDVAVLEHALESLGFETITVKDAGLAALHQALNQYVRRLRAAGPGAVGFFYYSGHGAQDAATGTNYLIPVDVQTAEDGDLWDRSLQLAEITRKLKQDAGEATHFVVFDACRNALKLKKTGTRALLQSKGFVPVPQQNGMLIAYATAEGELASDVGDGAGPYAKVLAQEIVKPGVEAVAMFRRVQVRVRADIGQEPWLGFSAMGEVMLAGTEAPRPPGMSTEQLMATCVREIVHPNAAALAERMARQLQGGKFEYGWTPEASPADRQAPKNKVANVLGASSSDDELRFTYDWQNGSFRLKAVAPWERATRGIRPPGTYGDPGASGTTFQGIWLQDNSFGCAEFLFSPSGEATGAWAVRTGALDAKTFVRRKQEVAMAAPAKPPSGAIDSAPRTEPGRPPAPGGFRDCTTCPEMVVIPAGQFTMGSGEGGPEERPPHKVSFAKPFAVSRYEVTIAEWTACVADGGCKYKPDTPDGGETSPVTKVSWLDITREYLPWLGRKTGKPYRLPTEAEWEYAAAAGSTAGYTWGDDDIGRGRANCNGCGSRWDNTQSAPVGSFQPNGFGLYDVHGNVWEWVADCYRDNYVGARTDGKAAPEAPQCWRVLRGGSWDMPPPVLRLTARGRNRPSLRSASVGFRVAAPSN